MTASSVKSLQRHQDPQNCCSISIARPKEIHQWVDECLLEQLRADQMAREASASAVLHWPGARLVHVIHCGLMLSNTSAHSAYWGKQAAAGDLLEAVQGTLYSGASAKSA